MRTTTQYFCTFFDHRYLDRGLALAPPLQCHDEPYHLWILCVDQKAVDNLSLRGMKDVTLVTMADLDAFDGTLHEVKKNRSPLEFYFTCKSFLCLYIFANYPAVNLLTYLDADLFFFGRPSIVEEEMIGSSIGLTGHRFPAFLKKLEQFGMFNAGFVSFRRDDEGLACLTWWRDRCTEWCHDYVDNGRYADQRYLDYIPGNFSRTKVINHKGINLAPWNIAQYLTTWSGLAVIIDDEPLVLFHFHGLKRTKYIKHILYDTSSYNYKTVFNKAILNYIYKPYINLLEKERGQGLANSSVMPRGMAKSEGFKTLFPTFFMIYRSISHFVRGLYYSSFMLYGKRNKDD